MEQEQHSIIGLDAVIISYTEEQPRVLTVSHTEHSLSLASTQPQMQLPFGPFEPKQHRTLEIGLRSWVGKQTGLPLGYVEQLYTFGDRYRDPREFIGGPRVVTVGYLALTRHHRPSGSGNARWRDWYDFLPWEDYRNGTPLLMNQYIIPYLKRWAADHEDRKERLALTFGEEGVWDPYRVLERYELLYEVGLVLEAHLDRDSRRAMLPDASLPPLEHREIAEKVGAPMGRDHRRILATAMSRLRGKLKYRPVVFELLPDHFTLLELQKVVESLSGVPLHKQNFRRLVTNTGLVEDTGQMVSQTRGRPAALFQFRREVLRERPTPGVGLPRS